MKPTKCRFFLSPEEIQFDENRKRNFLILILIFILIFILIYLASIVYSLKESLFIRLGNRNHLIRNSYPTPLNRFYFI